MNIKLKIFFEAKFRAFGIDFGTKRDAYGITIELDGKRKVEGIPFTPEGDPDFNSRGVKVWFQFL